MKPQAQKDSGPESRPIQSPPGSGWRSNMSLQKLRELLLRRALIKSESGRALRFEKILSLDDLQSQSLPKRKSQR